MKTLVLALACLIATVAVLFTVSPSTAFAAEDPWTPCAKSSQDTDGDCRVDSAETPACVSLAETTKRGGMVGRDGCAVSFLQCFRARPDAYYTCGEPDGWDSPGLRSFIDGLAWVVDGKGVRHQLEPRHLPLWAGGEDGGWASCSGGGILHVGEYAWVGGKKQKTGLPPQTPPFCHSSVMKIDSGRDTIRVVETRVELDAGTKETVDMVSGLGLDDEEDGWVVTRERARRTAKAVEDPETGLSATRGRIDVVEDRLDDPETGLAATRATAAAAHGTARAAKTAADDVSREVYDPDGTEVVSRIDTTEGEVRSLRREVRERSFILEAGYAGNGWGYTHDKWERPFLHGPLVRMGYRRDFGKWLFVARGYGTPYNLGTDGFSAGGHVGAAVRMYRPEARVSGDTVERWWVPTSVFIGATVGGGGWAVGAYSPGSAGYAAVSGGGVDVDGIVLVDIPKTPVSVSGSIGVRIHAVKYGEEGDTLIADPSAGIAFQLRL